ncbi:hypothetical protein GYMLUDRAFT_1004604 [Collybiopsis luxurians FD-317 M1]|uniref:Unplaced genomic scaffold GYMLUscaffold_32, whole genome shotgun sequence n=1 Tax=Collybiopsis luxurians FD-317 M1 TaxID=944289 RepID=A0A0D0C9T4_9AGAR|nr:hypothetical protein GYMLUDRAFT_1004604 [Collybiopsis luxurians FD-317 M1]
MILPAAIVLLFPFLFVVYVRRTKRFNAYPLPPGPRKLPIVENLFSIPKKGFVWLEYAEMCRKYGKFGVFSQHSDIIHLSALGNSIIVLNSAVVVSDLMEKRSSIYSSRPQSVMLGELMGWGKYLVFRPYDDGWKAQRKIVNRSFPPGDIGRFHPKLLSATHDLLRILIKTKDFKKDLQSWASVFILDIVYGIHAKETDSYLTTAVKAAESLALAATPGVFYVDQIPILKYVPEWFPGATFKRKAREWNNLRIKMTNMFDVTKEQIALGTSTPSLTSVALEQMDPSQSTIEQEELIKMTSAATYGGDPDSILIALQSFVALMLMHPEIQHKAHSELDKALGPGNLPSFSDEPSLPYITAIVWETLRLQPVAPLGIPHLVTRDDIYEGYFIPKGSIVIYNAWSIGHDEKVYPNPNQFNPSHFLDDKGKLNLSNKDPSGATFGFGRRICPGKHIVIASMFIVIASILTCYIIEPELDEHGKKVEPKVDWNPEPTLLNGPLPFKCRFIPRSKEIEESLRRLKSEF